MVVCGILPHPLILFKQGVVLLYMIKQHLECDGCGDTTLDATFNSGAYCDTDGSFDYSRIISEDIAVRQPISNTNWVREAYPKPEDPIAITFDDYCPECQ